MTLDRFRDITFSAGYRDAAAKFVAHQAKLITRRL